MKISAQNSVSQSCSAVVWVWKPNFGSFRCSQPFVCQVWLSSAWPECFTFSYCAWLWNWLIKGPVHFIEEFFSSLEKQSGLQENTNSVVLEVLLHKWNYRLTDWLTNREIDARGEGRELLSLPLPPSPCAATQATVGLSVSVGFFSARKELPFCVRVDLIVFL